MFILDLLSVKKQLIILIHLLLLSLPSTGQVFFNNLEETTVSGNWIGLQTVTTGSAFSGIHYSKADSVHPYGLGIEQKFPDELLNKNTVVVFSGYVKSHSPQNNSLFVITIVDDNNNTLLWKGITLPIVLIDNDNWHQFTDSIIVPANHTINSGIKAYLWNRNKSDVTYIDDLKVSYKPLNNPSFIPLLTKKTNSKELSTTTLYRNAFFSINHDRKNGVIEIYDSKNKIVVKSIDYYSERTIRKKKKNSFGTWKYSSQENHFWGTELKFRTKVKGSRIKLSVICIDTSSNIEFTIHDNYNRTQHVVRESLIFNYKEQVNKVFRSNRKVDASNFQIEYWLDKQGVQLGKGESSITLYHTPEISSLQLDTENKLLFVNLDFEKDHPFFRFPLNPDSNNWKKEESASIYRRGDHRDYRFSLNIGHNTGTIPRFMKNPKGYLATYIWTEHADFSDIRTNRAVYFGSELISVADSAEGGFVFYEIPVTKSVFYDNPDSTSNFDASNGVFNTLESTILTDPDFHDFLNQISDKGHEICLHTPEQYTTTMLRLEEALSMMQNAFGSPTWIDHGNNNGFQNNREDLVCDATLTDSPYYSIDLWNKYGVRYFHNPYYEELDTFKDWQYNGSLEKPYSGFGDFFPKPDYYTHPTRSKNIYHWTTTSALFVPEPDLWNYLFSEEKLNDLVNKWYVEINHTYPAWVDPQKGMWTYDKDSVIIAQPGFNDALSIMAKLRSEGKLNVCTIRDFLDYRTAIDKVKYEILENGDIRITNLSDTVIKDLSMVIAAKSIIIDGIIPDRKSVNNEIIFWFDISPGESKTIQYIE